MKLHEYLDYQRKLWEMDKRKYGSVRKQENNNDKKANSIKPSK
ncbi:MAG TPA: hypothetical protein VHP38_12520 [Ruminiclostridium sp.]|nr:hypothetical protein [Ruminiclostridium sp.]